MSGHATLLDVLYVALPALSTVVTVLSHRRVRKGHKSLLREVRRVARQNSRIWEQISDLSSWPPHLS